VKPGAVLEGQLRELEVLAKYQAKYANHQNKT
jgi:hypothetical protein